MSNKHFLIPVSLCLSLIACDPYFKNDYKDNSPTSGKLKVMCDEGMALHMENQVFTFEALYPKAHLQLKSASENDVIQGLYNDSCQAIVISRALSESERKAFAGKNAFPKFSLIALSGVALITNRATPITCLSYSEVRKLLSTPYTCRDSLNNEIPIQVLFDKSNSSVVHYLADSVLKGAHFSTNSGSLASSLENINYVAQHKNAVAFIDFAWLSDVDDSIYKANASLIKFICVARPGSSIFEYPNQSSFKLNTYPFTRSVYLYRNTGDFSLAKGFESFVAGPKGQLTFLKQGLMPARQGERKIEVKLGQKQE